VAELAEIIRRSSFSERKAEQIKAIAQQLVAEHNGELPCDRDLLLSFSGVGPKCANLALGIACDQKVISVDIHVHRVTNRWGYVAEKTPEKTMEALQATLPESYWIEINRLLVPFWQTHLHRQPPALRYLPSPGHVPAGWRNRTSLVQIGFSVQLRVIS
jgi:endonuclease-3